MADVLVVTRHPERPQVQAIDCGALLRHAAGGGRAGRRADGDIARARVGDF
jgi:hypothetical protein